MPSRDLLRIHLSSCLAQIRVQGRINFSTANTCAGDANEDVKGRLQKRCMDLSSNLNEIRSSLLRVMMQSQARFGAIRFRFRGPLLRSRRWLSNLEWQPLL